MLYVLPRVSSFGAVRVSALDGLDRIRESVTTVRSKLNGAAVVGVE